MGKRIPFFFTGSISLAGNATGQIVFRAGSGEKVHITKVVQTSTVDNLQSKSFVFDITDSNGQNYNATTTGATASETNYANKIDSRLIGDANHPTILSEELYVPGDVSLTMNIIETSGSTNHIAIMFLGYKELGSV